MKFPFLSLFKRRPAKIYSPLTTAEIQELVAPVVEQKLLPLGFELQKPLHWVESGNAPIRKMFCLLHLKGHTLYTSWGFSLDYVPHVSGSQVKWHRTAKSARIDLKGDTRDPRIHMSHIWGAGQFRTEMPDAIGFGLDNALKFWNSVACVADLPAAFEETKRRYLAADRGFYNVLQHPIAYAFTLARLDEIERARAELEKFYYLHSADENITVRDRIRVLFAEACVPKSAE